MESPSASGFGAGMPDLDLDPASMSAILSRPLPSPARAARTSALYSSLFLSCYGRENPGRFALRNLAGQMFRFGLVGLVNAGVDAAVFFATVAILTHLASAGIHPDWILILDRK